MSTTIPKGYALITGSGSGIGYELAIGFSQQGYSIIATDIHLDTLAKVERQLKKNNASYQCHALDVTDPTQWQSLKQALDEQGIIPDVLVNNAGIGYFAPLQETPPAIIDKTLDINVKGIIYGYQTFIGAMQSDNKPRTLVNIASAASKTPMPNMAVYAASKSAVEGLTDVIAMELAETKVHTMCVHPGIINTPIVQNRAMIGNAISDNQVLRLQRHYEDEGCHPKDVANDIIHAVAREQRVLYTGPSALLSGIASRLLPKRFMDRSLRKQAAAVGYL
ncbi:SDR family NAD(P)-dependent oxidoreductase [Maricurvus nonylphenolicus]|uniref:SDR family NAD(P)-dependent oxidoreductase n=1 Tax=Maricurvus nonylphenolicus TaxID=1008307 RepID=UPI0036F28529